MTIIGVLKLDDFNGLRVVKIAMRLEGHRKAQQDQPSFVMHDDNVHSNLGFTDLFA